MRYIATKEQVDKARSLILRELAKGPQTQTVLSGFQRRGIPSASVDLALHMLQREGLVEELYTLPTAYKGNRVKYYILRTWTELPENTVRYSEALEMVAV